MLATDQFQPTPDELLLRMPFDQYGRYRMVQEAIEAARQALGREQLRILDVGGYYQEGDGTPRLPSQQFLGTYDLTVLDLPPCDLPGYVQGDGTNLTYADDSFDLVISCDTLEHIPPPLRERFIGEGVRVARYGMLLICPCDDYRVALAEQVLFAYIKAELHARHDQLTEHREYGLPQPALVRQAFAQAGGTVRDYPSGDLYAWLPMMLAKHYLLRFAESQPELQYGLDELYNRSYALAERREPSYRRLFVAAKAHTPDWLAAVDGVLEPTVIRGEQARPEMWQGLATQVLELLQLGMADRQEEWRVQELQTYIESQREHIGNLDRIFHEHHRIIADLQQYIAGQRQHVSNLDRIIADQQMHIAGLNHRLVDLDQRLIQSQEQTRDLEQRAQWLERQAEAARHQLQAVERGRVIRLLRRLGL